MRVQQTVTQPLDLVSSSFTATSWLAGRKLSAADWVRCGRTLGAVGRACGWWLGDWVRYGNSRYGERYKLAAQVTGYEVQTLMNLAYVASRFELSRRREGLSFSHHAEVAALPAEEQDRLLDLAAGAGLSVRALRLEARRKLPERKAPPPRAARNRTSVCPNCGCDLGD